MFLCNNELPKSHRRLTLSHQSTALLNSNSVRERVKLPNFYNILNYNIKNIEAIRLFF